MIPPTPLTLQLINSWKNNNLQQIAVSNNENLLINLVPKQDTDSKKVIHGRMLLNKKIFTIKNQIKEHQNGEYYLPYELLNFKDVYLYSYQGYYFNIGNKLGYIKASIYYALKDEKQKAELLDYIYKIKEKENE